ncbi:family 20 glycosylhydrolase [Trueperella pecoris]|uniref:family 20 glycosylhydrolase n=1 Tax=Trueperella pecoris TaxID=2733571 RepID=UPI001ABE2E7A|nr:family 20 glycosylhydrolase [Trueperella pecoris]QTG76252.1 family 20 glycosylhydrolase [Trueperella pecoris]
MKKRRWFLGAIGAMSLIFSAFATSVASAEPDVAPGGYYASASTIKLPDTIPSLDNFKPAQGTWSLGKGARVVSSEDLKKRANMLSTELTAFLGDKVPAATGQGTAKDVVLTRDETRKAALGDEGFELTIGDKGLVVTAATDAGVFYGTRSVSQLLRQSDRGDAKLTLPAGSVISKPKYHERGATLCACQINISTEWIDRFLDDMADLRLNYLLLEMKVKSDKYPDTQTWSYYTPEDVKKFVAKAREYNIDVIPEINSPGHMEIWIENSPQYQLVRQEGYKKGEYRPSLLDISNPEARKLYKDLIDEYDQSFDTKYWHMGADEYMIGERSPYQDFPQLATYAKEVTKNPNATGKDAFIHFLNEINTHVKSKDAPGGGKKQLRIWNDGVQETQAVTLDKDIIVEYWFTEGLKPNQLFDRGYKVMNANDLLYFSRQNPGYKFDDAKIETTYNAKKWNVGSFPGNVQIDPEHKNLTGAKISIWPDESTYQTENEVAKEVWSSLRFISQMTWSGSYHWDTWKDMKAAAVSIGDPYIRSAMPSTDLPAGTYTIPELATLGKGPWKFTPTNDDYYQIEDTASGKCLALDTGSKHLRVVTEVGAQPNLRDCADMNRTWVTGRDAAEARNTQKWQVQAKDSAITLRNALTLQYLAIATGEEKHVDIQGVSAEKVKTDEKLLNATLSRSGNKIAKGKLAQFPRDLVTVDGKSTSAFKSNALFSITQELGISTDVTKLSDLNPSIPGKITATVSALGTKNAEASKVNIAVPEGWKALPAEVNLQAIPKGKSAKVVFNVVNTTATDGVATLTWHIEGKTLTTEVALSATLGPRVCEGFEDISTDSEETSGEPRPNGVATAAFDNDPDTYWHTEWKSKSPEPPHWLIFNPTKALTKETVVNDMLSVEYLPRQGKPNGRIENYKVYVSDTNAEADDKAAWGEPVAQGAWENNADWQRASFPAGTKAKFVKLEILSNHRSLDQANPPYTSAASICVSSKVPAVELVDPEQPKDNPVVTPEKPAPEAKPTPEKPAPEAKPTPEKPAPEAKPTPEKPAPEAKPTPTSASKDALQATPETRVVKELSKTGITIGALSAIMAGILVLGSGLMILNRRAKK